VQLVSVSPLHFFQLAKMIHNLNKLVCLATVVAGVRVDDEAAQADPGSAQAQHLGAKVSGVDTSKWKANDIQDMLDAGVLPSQDRSCPAECAAYSWAMMCDLPTCKGCDQCVNWEPVEGNLARMQKEQLLRGHYWPGGPCNKCTFLSNEEACKLEVCQNCNDFGIYCVPSIAAKKGCDEDADEERKADAENTAHKIALQGLDNVTDRELARAGEEKDKKDALALDAATGNESSTPAAVAKEPQASEAALKAIKEKNEAADVAQAPEVA
jgi:hypothetical protein